jgi:hypothetical protein
MSQRIRWAVYNCPTLLDSMPQNRITRGIVHDLLPRRTSIEIECFNNVIDASGFKEPLKWYHHRRHNMIYVYKYPEFAKHYGVYSMEVDGHQMNIDYDEHKISILNGSQLPGLYKVLQLMNKHCILNLSSGSHIHLDISNCMNDVDTLKDYLISKCISGEIERIFGPAPAPPRSLDHYELVSLNHGNNSWLVINETYKSIEFRCGPMTFSYSTIVKIFIAINKLLNEFEYKLQHDQLLISEEELIVDEEESID